MNKGQHNGVTNWVSVLVPLPGARGEADAQNITVLAMWMIEHPGEDDHDEPRAASVGGEVSCPGAIASAGGGKSQDRSSFLCCPGDISSADAAEMEEGFSERFIRRTFVYRNCWLNVKIMCFVIVFPKKTLIGLFACLILSF